MSATPLDPLGPSGLPDDIVEITSNSGTWTPDILPCWVRGRITGGGAAGEAGSTSVGTTANGGGAAASVEFVLYVTAPVPWSVGAAGTGSANGSPTSFGPYMAPGGFSAANGHWGGGYDPAGTQAVMQGAGITPGGAGGGTSGGIPTAGRAAGLWLQLGASWGVPLGGGDPGASSGSYAGGSGGGSSVDGKGGTGGAAVPSGVGNAGAAGDGYGSGGGGGGSGPAGGGAGGAGRGGRILLAVFYSG